MDLATGAIRNLRPKLLRLLGDEYKLPKNVRKQIQFLSSELGSIGAALEKIGNVPPEQLNDNVKLWARDVRELSYDVEDIVDLFLVPASCPDPASLDRFKRLQEKTVNLFRIKKKMTRLQIADGNINQFARSMEEIEGHLAELADRRERYWADAASGKPATDTVDPRLPAMYRNERELVGIDDARDELVKMLTQGDEKQMKVVSILGPGGIGKTTLAKAVYNRILEVQFDFDCRAFVQVSQVPNMEKVLMDILLQLDEEKYSISLFSKPMDGAQLINEISHFLHDKRYFFLFDDVWDIQSWKLLRYALTESDRGCRIVTTTRNSDVAQKAGDVTYRLKPLSHVNSEKLFYKRIFGGEGNCPDNQMAEVSDKILRKCAGLPLAIITAASVLAGKPWEEWSEVYNSTALRHESNRYVDNMRKVLSFSYYNLPFYLWACLLYISVFPEDSWIEKDFFIWKLIAEGFVQLIHGAGPFEVGENYFNEMVNRSIVQIEILEDRYKGPVYGCRVHPAMLDLIHYLSREERFLMILLDNEQKTSPKSDIVRRWALYRRNVEHDVQDKHSMSKLRSVNASLCFIGGMSELSAFQVLRVLALEYCTGMDRNRLKQIGNLVNLRYLGLLGTTVLELPDETVQGLWLLQTLDLRETGIEELPRTIIRLQKLMCLCADRARTVPEGMGRLESLEELRLHNVSNNSMNLAAELGMLRSLRVLVIGFEEMDERLEKALVESLHKLTNIQHLEVYCEASTRAVTWGGNSWVAPRRLHQLVVGGIRFPKLPKWINPSVYPKLSHLHMVLEVTEDADLTVLGNLQALRSLVLMITRDEQERSTINTVAGNVYPALRFFTTNMLIRFEYKLGAPMPRLEDIEFHVNVQAAKDANCWFGSLSDLSSSLHKVTVALKCRGSSPVEVEEAEAALRREVGILLQTRPTIEVITKNEADEVPFTEHISRKNPHFEVRRRELKKMQGFYPQLRRMDNLAGFFSKEGGLQIGDN